MAGIVRLMVYRNGVSNVIDCLYSEVKATRLRLSQRGLDPLPLGSSVMAAYTDIVANVGYTTSNSYVTGVEADSYAAFQAWESTWTGKTESERTIALINATKWLNTIDYAGTRCSPSANDSDLPQALAWPRSDASCDGVAATCTIIPNAIKEAQILIAYNLVVNPELITGTPGGGGGTQAGVYISKNQLGELVARIF